MTERRENHKKIKYEKSEKTENKNDDKEENMIIPGIKKKGERKINE